MATMNVSLPDPMKDWVEDQVKCGLYSNASDYVRDLIRQDQDSQNKRELLVRAINNPAASGRGISLRNNLNRQDTQDAKDARNYLAKTWRPLRPGGSILITASCGELNP